MVFSRKTFCVFLIALTLPFAPAFAQRASANPEQTKIPQHAVSVAELQKDIAASSAKRKADEAKIEEFFGSAAARQALKKAGVSYEIVEQAVPTLSASELAQLAARTDKAQKEFEAGALTNQQLTYIIIALATAVIILLIVVH